MSVIQLIKRYATKGPAIIVNRFASAPTTELVEDEGGKWMKFNDLLILLKKGAILEMSQALSDLIDDGQSQQAFVRDVTALGYTDFDQILKVLTECREHVLVEREFEIWAKSIDGKTSLLSKQTAFSFKEACDKLTTDPDPTITTNLSYDKGTGKYSNCHGELQPTS